MGWSELGQLAPNQDDWQFYEVPDIDGNLFRIRHSYDLGGLPAALLLCSYHPIFDAFFDVRKFYPSLPRQIFLMPVPAEFKNNGIVREIAIKATWRSNIHALDNWRVALDTWLEPVDPNRDIDGGEY